jgi:hypothetical protein
MRNSACVRQRILALFLPVAAVLYISCEALDPRGTDQLITNVATGLKLLAIASRHPAQLYVAGGLSLFALGAVAVSYAAIALLVTGRGWVIATVAAMLGATSAFCGAITNTLVGVNLAAAATALWRGRRVPLWLAALFAIGFDLAEGQSSKGPIVIAWMLPWLIAMVLLAVRLWRAASEPVTSPAPQPAGESPAIRQAGAVQAG